MVVLLVSEQLLIQSHRGPYNVFFNGTFFPEQDDAEPHYLIDANVAQLYASELNAIITHPNVVLIEATEENKSIENILPVIEKLISNKIRRDHVLIAVGGGIIQDITCFIASTLLRGLSWFFVPTTLLAQADSCIGSKSSINLRGTKNILGTFNPPKSIFINTKYLETLESKDVSSGIGEIIKVHAIDGIAAFDQLADDFEQLYSDKTILLRYIQAALMIKRRYIEQDEFDHGIRNIFNYGHSFGHAIESATQFAIPHGIAVSIGMDMANYIAVERGLLSKDHYHRMHPVLAKNYQPYSRTHIPTEEMLSALMKDKKNTSTMLGLIFPVGVGAEVKRVQFAPDDDFRKQCVSFLAGLNE